MTIDPSFSPPLSEIAKSGIEVATAPTGGKGVAADQRGIVPASALTEPWRYFADEGRYVNSWSDGGTGILRARFRRVAGIVFIEGQATRASPPAAATVIATLPNGYWPQNTIEFLVPDAGAAFPTVTQISVDSSGIGFQFWNGGAGAMAPHLVISFTPKS